MPSSRQEELLPTTSHSAAAPVKKARNWLYWAIPTAILVAAVVGITVGVVVGKGGSSSGGSDATAAAAGTPASAGASPSPSPASGGTVPSPSPAASSPAASGVAAGGSAPAVASPSSSPSPSPEPVTVKSGFTAAEVAAHNTPTDCWYIYGTKVVDITSYIANDLHPGGNDIMFPCCGKDCTKDFDDEHRGQRAHREQAAYYIGDLAA